MRGANTFCFVAFCATRKWGIFGFFWWIQNAIGSKLIKHMVRKSWNSFSSSTNTKAKSHLRRLTKFWVYSSSVCGWMFTRKLDEQLRESLRSPCGSHVGDVTKQLKSQNSIRLRTREPQPWARFLSFTSSSSSFPFRVWLLIEYPSLDSLKSENFELLPAPWENPRIGFESNKKTFSFSFSTRPRLVRPNKEVCLPNCCGGDWRYMRVWIQIAAKHNHYNPIKAGRVINSEIVWHLWNDLNVFRIATACSSIMRGAR